MDSKELKLTVANYIIESELTKPSKLQMINFIKNEANDHQLMALMLDGKIVDLDEQAKQIVEDRFVLQEGILTIAILVAAGAIIYSKFLKQSAKACSGLSGSEKKSCMRKYEIEARDLEIKELEKRIKKDCNSTENPEKCKLVLKTKITSLTKQISQLKRSF